MSQILPKYTAEVMGMAIATINTLAELEKFWKAIADNQHLSAQYKRTVKTHYTRRKKILNAANDTSE